MSESQRFRRATVVPGSWAVLLVAAAVLSDHPAVARPGADDQTGDPLVTRGRVELTLEGARLILRGAEARARALGVKENIAVVDQGGHLAAFERMDGARPASGYSAITKATSAATFRQATGPIGAGDHGPDPLLNLSLQNAAAASGGKFTTLKGGVPIEIEGQIIGAVGVGGGTGEQDALVAKAGVQALLDQLQKSTGGRPPSSSKQSR